MAQITNFREAQDALRPYYDNSHTMFTTDVMHSLMAQLGNPQNQLRVLHIAGTSGKTSTAYYSAALLRAAGFSVGLTVSPHVDTMNERLQVNGSPLPEAEFCARLSQFMELLKQTNIKPSYFELMTAMAYWQFARQGLDYAVIEVGLGGRLDATNVIDRADKVCLITDIGLDHTEILGDTLAKIATEKAGIIGNGNAVFMYGQGSEVDAVVQAAAAKHKAELHTLQPSDQLPLPGLPLFQQRNLGLASQAVSYVLQRDGHSELQSEQVSQAAQITVPARLERLSIGNQTVIVDGSHNQQKMQALLQAIDGLYPQQKMAALVGFVKGNDRRWQGAIDELIARQIRLILTSFHGEQDLPKSSVDPQVIANYCRQQKYNSFTVVNEPAEALAALLKRSEPLLLATGSFYLLNHIRPLILKAV